MHETSLSRLEVAGVLPSQGRQYRARNVVFNGAVGKVGTKAFSIACRTLPITRFAVFCLTEPRKKAVPGNQHVIERSLRDDLKLLLGRQGRNLADIFQSQEVR